MLPLLTAAAGHCNGCPLPACCPCGTCRWWCILYIHHIINADSEEFPAAQECLLELRYVRCCSWMKLHGIRYVSVMNELAVSDVREHCEWCMMANNVPLGLRISHTTHTQPHQQQTTEDEERRERCLRPTELVWRSIWISFIQSLRLSA